MYERCLSRARTFFRDVLSSRSLAGSHAACGVTQDADEGVRRIRPVRSLHGVGASGPVARLDAGGDAPHPGRVAPVQRASTDGTGPHCKHLSGKHIGREPAGRTSPCGFQNSSSGATEAGEIQAEQLGCEGTCEPVAQDGLTATRQAEAEAKQRDRTQPQGVQEASRGAAAKKTVLRADLSARLKEHAHRSVCLFLMVLFRGVHSTPKRFSRGLRRLVKKPLGVVTCRPARTCAWE